MDLLSELSGVLNKWTSYVNIYRRLNITWTSDMKLVGLNINGLVIRIT